MSDGWTLRSIGELCDAPKLRKAEVGTVPYIEIGDVDVVSKLINLKDKPAVKGSVLAPASSLLVSRVRPTRGAITLLSGTQAVSSAFLALQPKSGTNLRLLFYWLAYSDDFRAYLEGVQIGSLYPSVREEDILKYRVNYSSDPDEQQRIVGLLDEAFEGIAITKTNAEKNLQNARAIFQSYKSSRFKSGRPGWVDTALGEICGFVRGPFGGSLKKAYFVDEGYAVYEQQHAINNQFDAVRYFIPEKKFNEMKRFELLCGDLVMSCSGTMGRVAIVPSEIQRGIINQALLKLTPGSKLLTKFLKYWMESDAFQDALRDYSGGAAIQNVAAVKILKQIKMSLPPVEEQSKIVEELDCLNEQVQSLSRVYERKSGALDSFKNSLLKRLFSGSLVAV